MQVRADSRQLLTVGNVSDAVTVAENTVAVKFNNQRAPITIAGRCSPLAHLGANPFRLAYIIRGGQSRLGKRHTVVGGRGDGRRRRRNGKLDPAVRRRADDDEQGLLRASMDAVREFTVNQNAVDAGWFGAGGSMSLSMRSGTNALHGTAYYFGRNPKLNAVSDAISRTPNFVRNHIAGGTVGHPILKNKLFSYTAFEVWRIKDPRSNLRTLPTDLERTGDFSQSKNGRVDCGRFTSVVDGT